MKKLPKYIELALKRRSKAATALAKQQAVITEYAERLGCVNDPEGGFMSDIRVICEGDRYERGTRECLLKHLNESGSSHDMKKNKKILDPNANCLFCVNSFSADSPADGSEILVCYDCPGHIGKEMIVDEDDAQTCGNYKRY